MMKNNVSHFILFLHLVFMLSSCYIAIPVANKDYAHLYSQKSFKIEPRYKVYHISNTKSKLYLFIESNKLLFAKPVFGDSLQSKLQIHYRLFPNSTSTTLLDSATFLFIHNKPVNDIFFTDSLSFPSNLGNQYILELVIRDVNRREEFEDIIYIDKTKNYNEQFFLLQQNGNIVHNQFNIEKSKEIKLSTYDTSINNLIIRAYQYDFHIAVPPFSTDNDHSISFKPDSVFKINNNQTYTFNILHNGYYYIQTDTTQQKGVGFFSYHEGYPKFISFEEMIGPLRYITTRNEFEQLILTKDAKQSIDQFWLELSGNKERARELIKQYYSRVQYANYYFTSYKEGWKTDRGMIYVVFGAPNYVSRNGNIESWTYGEQNNYRSLNFFFTKQEKSINENDYKLERNPLFKDEWMQAVDVWRQGRVYNPYN